jgi:hypothetical protein
MMTVSLVCRYTTTVGGPGGTCGGGWCGDLMMTVSLLSRK